MCNNYTVLNNKNILDVENYFSGFRYWINLIVICFICSNVIIHSSSNNQIDVASCIIKEVIMETEVYSEWMALHSPDKVNLYYNNNKVQLALSDPEKLSAQVENCEVDYSVISNYINLKRYPKANETLNWLDKKIFPSQSIEFISGQIDEKYLNTNFMDMIRSIKVTKKALMINSSPIYEIGDQNLIFAFCVSRISFDYDEEERLITWGDDYSPEYIYVVKLQKKINNKIEFDILLSVLPMHENKPKPELPKKINCLE